MNTNRPAAPTGPRLGARSSSRQSTPASRPTRPGHAAEDVELVVLLDAFGRPVGARPKRSVHSARTPLHLGFSCHVVDREGRVLLARRSRAKETWPATWSNACCGHPQPGETLRHALTRRLDDELGLTPLRMGIAVSDFVYRAVMVDGVTEHELCPVVIAEIEGEPAPDPAEVDDVAWMEWERLWQQALHLPETLSPWSVDQIAQLATLAPSPRAWLDVHVGSEPGSRGEIGLDRPAAGARNGTGTWVAPGACDAMAPVRDPLDRVLGAFLAARAGEVTELDPAIEQVSAAVRDLTETGGKRLRPAFVYWGHRSAGASHDDAVIVAAAALELLHTFALIHDDIMDRSVRRRGRQTVHVAMAENHRAERLVGDGGWFGLSGALLAGDLAFVWADQLLDSTPLPAAALDRARRVFTQLRTEVISGQYLDLRLAHRQHGEEGDAHRVALLKSARYTVTRPLQLGAALAGQAPENVTAALARYGDAVGLAFQLRDDVLGLFGDPSITGKSRIDDLREGKRTLLVQRALRLSSGHDLDFLTRSLGDPELDEDAARWCCGIIARSGALASVEALIDAQHSRAVHELSGVNGPARSALEQLACLAIDRDH